MGSDYPSNGMSINFFKISMTMPPTATYYRGCATVFNSSVGI